MRELNNNIFNNNIAGDTSNILIPDNSAIKKGVVFKSNIDSNVLNGFYNIKTSINFNSQASLANPKLYFLSSLLLVYTPL